MLPKHLCCFIIDIPNNIDNMHDRFIVAAKKLIIHSGVVQTNNHQCFVISSHVGINGPYVSVIHIAEDYGH